MRFTASDCFFISIAIIATAMTGIFKARGVVFALIAIVQRRAVMPDAVFSAKSNSRFDQYDGNEFNVYCDETCHLEHDGSKAMALGAVWAPKAKVKAINTRIREIKAKHGIRAECEVKWTKAAPCNMPLYLDLVDYFFDDDDLCFRALVVPDKGKLNHAQYHQTHDQWYYKMYFDMLKVIFRPSSRYYVYIDIKDTHSGQNAHKLGEVCANNAYDFDHKIVRNVQPIRSDEVQLMQLVDILTGALGYIHNYSGADRKLSSAKVAIVNKIIARSGYGLMKSTLPTARKFNVFIWSADWRDR